MPMNILMNQFLLTHRENVNEKPFLKCINITSLAEPIFFIKMKILFESFWFIKKYFLKRNMFKMKQKDDCFLVTSESV